MVLSLISKEIEIALQCLNKGGNFLIKMFTFFEERTVQLLITLMNNFRQVICTKPPSSKPGNSEVVISQFFIWTKTHFFLALRDLFRFCWVH
jgi:23S rRNA U2552 (ribose-2'-O)-methylase RlmE/FtsJ